MTSTHNNRSNLNKMI